MGSSPFTGFKKHWGCGSVTVTGPPDAADAIRYAIGVWNGALNHPAVPGVPTFRFVTSSADVTVTKPEGGSFGSLWCGGADPDRGSYIVLTGYIEGVTCATNRADMGTTLVHEFAHVVGFHRDLHKNNAPSNCAVHLPADGSINGSPCQHEIEMVFAAYGYTTLNTATFWGERIATGVSFSPPSLTVEVGQAANVAVTAVRYARQLHGSGAAGSANLSWEQSNANITIQAPTNVGATVGGEAVGSAMAFAKITSASGARVGTIARLKGDSIPVSVTAGPPPPPPGTGFRVSDIVGPAIPVTVAGSYYVTAEIENKPLYDLYTRWEVSYSNRIRPNIDVDRHSDRLLIDIPAGSYSIRIKVTPRSGQYTGTPLIEDWPVCTGGSGGGGDGPLDIQKQGGDEIQAKEGC